MFRNFDVDREFQLLSFTRVLVLCAVLVCTLLSSFTQAHAADIIPGSCPQPGTVITTSINETLTFSGGDGLECSIKSSRRGAYKILGLVTVVNSMNYAAAKREIAKLWPLEVGKIVQFTATRGSYQWVATYKVTEKKDLTVKAGTFPVYVVVYEEEQISQGITHYHTGIYHCVWTFYISTDLGYLVKMDYESISGGPSAFYAHTPWEAVSIEHP